MRTTSKRRIGAWLAAVAMIFAGLVASAPAASAASYTCNDYGYKSDGHTYVHVAPRYASGSFSTHTCYLSYNVSQFNGAVQQLQNTLKICYGANIVPDGYYGNNTIAAVKDAQRQEGFTGSDVDGLYGPMTRNVLSFASWTGSTTTTPCHEIF